MKLNTNHTNIERGGVHSESTFTIKTNALSFSILSSGLYTDPEMAIVRELSCNAYDAHVAANNESTPFDIHLPNDLEPFLSIKDYGIGLSDEDIQGAMVPAMRENDNGQMVEVIDGEGNTVINRTGGLYTTYFDSTKTNSNDFIGALGLGSKSPFSYSNAFEVISRHKGKKRTYAIFLNEEGIPSVALMGVINTDEHSGLEVKIAIKPNDFYKFKTKTATALKYFPVKPKITGVLYFEFDAIPEYKIKTKDWMLSSTNHYNNGGTITAVQGNVAYRVDTNQVLEHLNDKLKDFVGRLSIVVFFNIGELEVSANREEIRYDKRSVDTIVKRIEKINVEFTREVENKIGVINTNYWYACIELNELSRNLFEREDAIRSFVNPDEVKNKILKRYIEDNGKVAYTKIMGYEIIRYNINGYYSKQTKLKRSPVSHIFKPEGNTLLVINDVKTGGIKRIGTYLAENSYNNAIVITKRAEPYEELDALNKPIKYQGYTKELKRLTKELGAPDIHILSDITNAQVIQHNRSLTFYKYDGMTGGRTYYASDKISWVQTSCKLEDGGLYIPLKYASSVCFVNPEGGLSSFGLDGDITRNLIHFLINEYNNVAGTEYNIHDIRGLPTATFNKAKKMDKWVNLFDCIDDVLSKYLDGMIFHESKKLTSNDLNIKNLIMVDEFVKNVKNLNNNSVFKSVIMPLIEGNETYSIKMLNNIDVIEQVYYIMHGKWVTATPFYENGAFVKYPMLTVVDELSYNTEWSILFDYIKLIDRSK